MPYVEPALGNYEPGTYLDRDPLAEGEEATEACPLSPILRCRGIYRASGAPARHNSPAPDKRRNHQMTYNLAPSLSKLLRAAR